MEDHGSIPQWGGWGIFIDPVSTIWHSCQMCWKVIAKHVQKKNPPKLQSQVFLSCLYQISTLGSEYSVLTRVLWITLHSYEIPEGEWAEEAQVSVTRGTQQHEVTETTGQCPSPGQCRSLSSLHVVPVLAVHLWVQGKDDQTKDVPMGCTAASLRLRDAAEMWPSPAQCFF